ncbi:MAG: hypothetical protein IKX36_09510 [Prevotella sp.]|nr:hypothetical protein [Prevotella sp.]
MKQEYITPTIEEMERVDACRALCFETLTMVNALGKQADFNSAMETIRRCFENEKGAASTNRAAVEIMSEWRKPRLTMFINTEDESILYPHLYMLCVEAAKKRLQGDKQERAIYYLGRFIAEWESGSFKPQQAAPEPQQEQGTKDLLPINLQGDEAVEIFQRAIGKGMIEKTATGLKWCGTKAQLAYFMGHFLKDGVFPDKDYSTLFGVQRLGKAYSQLPNNKNGDGKPRGYETIDALF